MGVIFKVSDDTNDLLVPFVKRRNPMKSTEEICDAYVQASLGKITADGFWHKMGISEDCSKEYLDSSIELDENAVPAFERLSENYRIGLLSNDVSEWSAYLREKFDLNRFFDCCIVSGDVGLRKPDIEIYKLALKTVGCRAEDCLFTDDRLENLLPASALGMKVVKFNRNDGFDSSMKFAQTNNLLGIPIFSENVFLTAIEKTEII